MNLNFLNVKFLWWPVDLIYYTCVVIFKAELDDLSYNDDYLNDMFDISGDAGNFMNQKRLLESSNIPLYRKY